MRKFICILLAVLMLTGVLALPLTVSADETIPKGLEIFVYGDYAKVTAYNGSAASLTLPTTYNGVPVKVIRSGAFKNNTTLTSIVIPEGYEEIENDAFYGCTNLASVSLPNSLTNLGGAFTSCDALTSFTFPDKIWYIAPNTLSYCDSLKTLYIPKSVTDIGVWACRNCNITDIYYAGSQYDWKKIIIEEKNENLTADTVTMHYAEADPANYSVISSAAVSGVVAPVGGQNPSCDVTVSGGTVKDDVMWKDVDGDFYIYDFQKFTAGRKYSVNVVLVPPENSIFATNGNNATVTATINGEVAECTGSGGKITVSKTFTASASEQPQPQNDIIDNVTITGVTEPVAGAHPVEAATVSGGVLDDFGWYDKTGGDWITTSDTFKSGNVYQAKAYIKAADGKKFKTSDGKPDVTVTINGKPAKVNKVGSWEADEGFVATVSYGEYTVSFNSNGGSGNMPDDGEQNGGYILPDCGFTAPEGMKFKAWAAKSADGTQYSEGYEYDVNEDVTFYAVWEAVQPVVPNDFEYEILGDRVVITKYIGNGGEVEIPSDIGGKTVYGIASGAFANDVSVTSVTIHDSVEFIGDGAFFGCENLASITIGSKVDTIGEDVFFGTAYYNDDNNWKGNCLYIDGALIKVLPMAAGILNIESGTRIIAASAARDCGNITGVTIPDTVVYIGGNAFLNTAIKEVSISGAVKSIGSNAFGYTYDSGKDKFVKVEGFVIHAENGTAASQYAADNGFTEPVVEPVVTADKFVIKGVKDKVYTGKVATQNPVVTYNGKTLKKNVDYYLDYKGNVSVGTAKVTLYGMEPYSGKQTFTFKITKAQNPISATAASKSVKLKDIKKKTVTVKNAITVKQAKGDVSYKLSSVPSSIKKLTKISSKGVITIKKWAKAKKGTYKVKVRVTAKGNKNYKSGYKDATVTIRVK